MNPQVRTKPNDTRERIIETAEALFRRLGFAKTAVADIAGGRGHLLRAILKIAPNTQGILFDQLHVVR